MDDVRQSPGLIYLMPPSSGPKVPSALGPGAPIQSHYPNPLPTTNDEAQLRTERYRESRMWLFDRSARKPPAAGSHAGSRFALINPKKDNSRERGTYQPRCDFFIGSIQPRSGCKPWSGIDLELRLDTEN